MKKIIKYFLLCLIVFTPILCFAGEDKVFGFYISPGIRFGWDFEKKFTFSTKISLGCRFDGVFANITYGCKYPVNQDVYVTDPHFEKYDYLDVQAGFLLNPKKDLTLYTGGGVGIIFYKEKGEHKTAPRMTVFSGCIIFPTLDIIFLPVHTRWDTGLQIVAPIPFVKDGFIAGT